MRKLTAEERKNSRGVRVPGTDAELDFIIDNTQPDERFDVLMALAKRNALIEIQHPGWHSKRKHSLEDVQNLVDFGTMDDEIDHPAFTQRS